MRYATAEAFRTALEDRLLKRAHRGTSVVRLRKQVVFERLLRRLQEVAPDGWLLKGGFALELRLAERARATKDIDVDWELDEEEATEALLRAAELDLGDFFEVRLERVATPPDVVGRERRWRATARLAGRTFEQVIVDVGFSVLPLVDPDRLHAPGLLHFAGLDPATIPAAALEQHLAEKLHAYTRRYAGDRPSSRPKDLIDIVLIGDIAVFNADRLHDAIARLFEVRATHPVPRSLPSPPSTWATSYAELAEEVGLARDLDAAHAEAAAFLDPLLSNEAAGRWKANQGLWERIR